MGSCMGPKSSLQRSGFSHKEEYGYPLNTQTDYQSFSPLKKVPSNVSNDCQEPGVSLDKTNHRQKNNLFASKNNENEQWASKMTLKQHSNIEKNQVSPPKFFGCQSSQKYFMNNHEINLQINHQYQQQQDIQSLKNDQKSRIISKKPKKQVKSMQTQNPSNKIHEKNQQQFNRDSQPIEAYMTDTKYYRKIMMKFDNLNVEYTIPHACAGPLVVPYIDYDSYFA